MENIMPQRCTLSLSSFEVCSESSVSLLFISFNHHSPQSPFALPRPHYTTLFDTAFLCLRQSTCKSEFAELSEIRYHDLRMPCTREIDRGLQPWLGLCCCTLSRCVGAIVYFSLFLSRTLL